MKLRSYTGIFTKQLKKKIDKTTEARSGKGIYKRRNNRNYRVIIHYSTYQKIINENPDFLKKYENGYAVRISPEEYFESEQLAAGLEIGKNAFVYYKTIESYRKYPPKKEWNEIIELYTSNSDYESRKNAEQEWVGEYAKFINNTSTAKVSRICKSNHKLSKAEKAELKEKYNLKTVPAQAGLGNFDYDYASKEEQTNIKYQLSFLLLNINNMDEHLYELCKNDLSKRELEFSNIAYEAASFGKQEFMKVYQQSLDIIVDYCDEHNLLDFKKLEEIRAWSNERKEPVCQLCLETLSAKDFLETELQVDGREEEDNTRSKIALMHIHALKPGEINHRAYNLGWGHRHCNQIQEDMDIETTLLRLKKI